jgi:hypothetical protein
LHLKYSFALYSIVLTHICIWSLWFSRVLNSHQTNEDMMFAKMAKLGSKTVSAPVVRSSARLWTPTIATPHLSAFSPLFLAHTRLLSVVCPGQLFVHFHWINRIG